MFLKSCRYNVLNYAFNYTLLLTCYSMIWGGLSAVVSSIEKRYSLSSAQSGFIFSAAEIGRIPCLVIVSHFGNRFSIPRLIAVAGVLISACQFLIALPHFIFKPVVSTSKAAVLSNEFCGYTNTTLLVNVTSSHLETATTEGNVKAYAMIVTGMVLMGMSASPIYSIGFSYIDNNAIEGTSPVLIGFTQAGISIGPIIASFLASYYMAIYVDISGTNLTPNDASWVGAWWLLVLTVSFSVLLSSPWMACYPKDTRTNPLSAKPSLAASTAENNGMRKISEFFQRTNSVTKKIDPDGEYADSDKVQYSMSGLFHALIRIFKNPLLLCLVVFAMARDAAGIGLRAYLPKYIETQFGETASRASLLAGMGGVPEIFGSLFIGIIFKKFKLSYLATVKLMIGAIVVIICVNAGRMFVGCHSPALSSTVLHNGKELQSRSCNIECGCSTKLHIPYCDRSSDLTYFSPCHAGCSSQNNSQVLSNCTCAPNIVLHRGSCLKCESYKFPLFVSLWYIESFSFKLTFSPFMNLVFRCVRVSDKSLALGVSFLIISLLSWFTAPLYYGKLIDLTCSVWQMVDGSQGSCWMYSLERFRYYFCGLSTALNFTSLVFLVISLFIAKTKKIDWSSELVEKQRRESEMSESVAMIKVDEHNITTDTRRDLSL